MCDAKTLHEDFTGEVGKAPSFIAAVLEHFTRSAKVGVADPFQTSHRLVQYRRASGRRNTVAFTQF
jgi:hypothetical protein